MGVGVDGGRAQALPHPAANRNKSSVVVVYIYDPTKHQISTILSLDVYHILNV